MKYKYIVILCLISLIIGYSIKQPKTKIVETVKIQEVVKTEVIDKSKTKTIKITKPDGTIIERTSKNNDIDYKSDRVTKIDSKKVIESKNEVIFGLGLNTSLNNLTQTSYEAMLAKRIYGPAFLGIKYNTNNQVGAFLLFEL